MWGSELGLGLVWLGATLLMLADASLGLALGLLLLSIGLAAGEVVAGQMNAALVLLLSGGIAAALQLRGGNSGWGLAHAGFTPRLMLSILVLVVVLLVAAVFHLNAPLWEAAAVTILLAGTRLIETNHRAAARAAIVALALGLIELMVTQGGIKLAQPTVPVLMMLGACGIGLLLSVLGVSPQMSRRSWLTGVVIGGVGLVLLGLAHQPILLAALLLLLIGLNSLRRDESGDRWRLRYPGLGVLLLSVSGLLLTFPLPFMSRLGSLALLLGIAAAAGLLPYLHRAQAAERGSINDPLLWSTIAAPLLAVVIFTQVVPTLPAVTQGEVRLFSLLLGLGNLGWGLLMA
ncbi:MAG: hypothetical protein ACREP9_02970, partial [Candidatus Dormibacteraceae bacterium]